MTNPIAGRVLRSGETITCLRLSFSDDIADGWNKLDKARFGKLTMSLCQLLDVEPSTAKARRRIRFIRNPL